MEQIMEFIYANIWQLLIIIALLAHHPYWKFGIFLLFSEMFWGFRWYIYAIVCVLVLISDVTNINENMKKSYEKRIKQLEDQLKDPDYR